MTWAATHRQIRNFAKTPCSHGIWAKVRGLLLHILLTPTDIPRAVTWELLCVGTLCSVIITIPASAQNRHWAADTTLDLVYQLLAWFPLNSPAVSLARTKHSLTSAGLQRMMTMCRAYTEHFSGIPARKGGLTTAITAVSQRRFCSCRAVTGKPAPPETTSTSKTQHGCSTLSGPSACRASAHCNPTRQ